MCNQHTLADKSHGYTLSECRERTRLLALYQCWRSFFYEGEHPREKGNRKEISMEILLQVVLLIVGFVMLVKGADWFVGGAAKIADKFGIPHLVVGLTIVAMGTSAPEAAVSISAGLQGSASIAVGNVVGSNIMNILLILGLTAVIKTIAVQTSTVKYEIPFMIGITVLFVCLGFFDGTIGRLDGIVLLVLMVVYLIYLLHMAKAGKTEIEEIDDVGNNNMPMLIAAVIVGGVLIVWGADVTVDAASKIAAALGMSQRLIGLTIVAFGTSLPELITSATAACKGKADIAIGNIVGSNIFNILFVIGITGVITPIPYAASFAMDSIICIVAAVLLFIFVLLNKKLTRTSGIIMLAAYAAYFGYLLVG